jgi:transposase
MKKELRYGRRYDAPFKEQAVKLLLSSGKSLHCIARELGVSDAALDEWKQEHLRKNDGVDRYGRRVTAEQLFIENQQLRRNLERVTTERDILKKSLGILSQEPPQKDMPK